MNLPWVQQIGAVLPWRRTALAALLHGIQVGCTAAVITIARDLLQISVLLQISQCPFDRGA